MKTAKLIFALSFALIFFAGMSTSFAGKNQRSDIPVDRKARMVAYVVRIENLNYIANHGSHFLVMMTDEAGNLVAPAQTFRPGVSDYTFFEGGTVRGTRIAKLMRLPIGPKSFDIPATSKTGIFYGGASYLFIIRPVPAASDTDVDKH
ncbi:MAG: hypothetical protein NT040_03480 [Bacteroidetes bacterium]|nr:hypothetical protein [Bacteroidota bacterium]